MSEKERAKKDHERPEKKNKRMRERENPRAGQGPVKPERGEG
jgi:hypothetical protein